MNGRRASVLSTIPFLLALIVFAIAHFQIRRSWVAEDAFGYSLRSIRQEQYQSAQDHLTRALLLAPDDAHYHAHLAILNERMVGRGIEPFTLERPAFDKSQLDHLHKAIQSYQNTLRLNPADDAAYHNLGWLYWFTRQDDLAVESAEKAVALDHGAYIYHVSLGMLRELRGEKDAAFGEYETALYLSSGLLDSRFFRDFRRRWPHEAEALITSVTSKLEVKLRDGFEPVSAGKLGRLYMEWQPERALELLEATTRALPNLSRPWSNLGRLYELQGDKSRMKDCYERTLFLEGSHTLSWYRLGSYYDERNQAQDAARSYERAVNFFLRPESNHSWVVRRIYHSSFTLFDDVIPRGLLSYTGSNIDLPAACRRLSEIHKAAGDHNRAKHFAELGEEYARKFDFSYH